MPRGDRRIVVPPPVGGLIADMPEWLQPLASLAGGTNVVLRYGKLYIRSGFAKLDSAGFGERVMGGIFWEVNPTTILTVAGGLTKRRKFSGGLWNDITGSAWTGTADSHARFVVFPLGNALYLIGVNGKDATIEWDGVASTDNNLGGGAPIAKDITAAANRVIYGHVTTGGMTYPYAFMYSAFNNHQSTPAANIIQLAEGRGHIVAVRNLGVQAFAIYTQQGQFVASAQSGSAPFRVDFRSAQPGPCSPAAVVMAGEGVHYYLGIDGNAFRFDGTMARPIGNRVRKEIQGSMNMTHRYRAHGAFDRTNREIYWFWPSLGTTNMDAGICYNIDTEVWSPLLHFNRNISMSMEWDEQSTLRWLDLSGTWITLGQQYATWLSMGGAQTPIMLLGQDLGQTYSMAGQTGDDGDAIGAEWLYPIRAFVGDGRLCRLDAVESYFKQLNQPMTLSLQVQTVAYPGASRAGLPTQNFDMSAGGVATAVYSEVNSRFLGLRYIVSGLNVGMEFQGALVYLYDRGVST